MMHRDFTVIVLRQGTVGEFQYSTWYFTQYHVAKSTWKQEADLPTTFLL